MDRRHQRAKPLVATIRFLRRREWFQRPNVIAQLDMETTKMKAIDTSIVRASIAIALWCASGTFAVAVQPTPGETAEARNWVTTRFEGEQLFFTFTYGGNGSADLLGSWKVARETRQLDSDRTEHRITYSDPQTGLAVQCVGIEYRDFPAVEWVLYFENGGDKDTPILEEVYPLSTRITRAESGTFALHHIKGGEKGFDAFAPVSDTLSSDQELVLQSHGWPTSLGSPSGSSSVETMPMFNMDSGGEGVIAGLGWTGPWVARFQREGDKTLLARAKMDGTHLLLHPGERIRSPRVLLLFWKGDRIDAQNLWRRLILAHYSPQPGGKPFAGMICDLNWGHWMKAENVIKEIDWWQDHDLPMECYWMDAAWTDMSKGWVAHQSQQIPNEKLFPQGLRPLSDAAHRRDMKFSLWFVPESIQPGVGIGAEHPEWLLKPFSHPQTFGDMVFYGLDYGDPKVKQFMIDYFSKMIADYGIDVFRQDGTCIWPEDTGPDRLGVNQIRYIEGFYAFWDGLLKNHPNLLIDNCGCGARKVDLETMRRSIVLWRNDSQASQDFDPASNQAFNYGLFPWVPLSGGVVPMGRQVSAYSFRSAYCPALVLHMPGDVDDLDRDRWSKIDVVLLRRYLKEYLQVRPYLFGDFYPLTPYTGVDQAAWIGYQYDRPDLGEGMVQAFRRPESASESIHVKLGGLVPDAIYVLTNLDIVGTTEMTGRELRENGLSVGITDRPGAAIVTYKRK